MLLNNLLQPRKIAIVVGIVALFATGGALLNHFKPEVKINVTGDHTPIDNYAYLNGQRLFPYGEGGKNYGSKLKYGKNNLEMRGPFIKPISTELNAGLVGEVQFVEFPLSPRSSDDILKEMFSGSETKFTGTRFFKSSNAIISSQVVPTTKDSPEQNYRVVLLQYNQDEAKWENITESYSKNKSIYILEAGAINYLNGLRDE